MSKRPFSNNKTTNNENFPKLIVSLKVDKI